MKYILFFLFLAFAGVSFAQDAPVKFDKTEYTFGKIKQDVPVTTEFTFTNTSGKPIIISTALADCGCTTPDYPKTPVLNGKTATIKVTYNAELEGHFDKKITVSFARVQQPVILMIHGDVEKKEK